MKRRCASLNMSGVDLVFQRIMDLCVRRCNNYGFGADLEAFCTSRIGNGIRTDNEMHMINTVMSSKK